MNEDRDSRADIILNRKLQIQLRELQVALEVSVLCGWGNRNLGKENELNLTCVLRRLVEVREFINNMESQLLATNNQFKNDVIYKGITLS